LEREELDSKIRQHEGQIAYGDKELIELNNVTEQLELEISSLSLDNENLKIQMEHYTMLYDNCNKSYAQLQSEYSNISNREDMKELINQCNEKIKDLESKSKSDLEYLRSQIDDLNIKLVEVNTENEKLQSNLNDSTTENIKLKKDIELATNDFEIAKKNDR